MKLSAETIEILKNFSLINSSIIIKAGTRISTRSQAGNLVAAADVIENFPREFGIHDLNEFLSVLSMFKEPVMNFVDDYKVTITEGPTEVSYAFANPSMLLAAPSGLKELDTIESFELNAEVLKKLISAASIMTLPQLTVEGNGTIISLVLSNPLNNSSLHRSYKRDIGETEKFFQAIIEVENIKIIPGNYHITVNNRTLKFSSLDRKLTYWIALSKNSRF